MSRRTTGPVSEAEGLGPRLKAKAAVQQLLAIRALNGWEWDVEVYKRPLHASKLAGAVMQVRLKEPWAGELEQMYVWTRKCPYTRIVKWALHSVPRSWSVEYLPIRPPGSVAQELFAIARRAYIPQLVTQIYKAHPLMQQLAQSSAVDRTKIP